MVSGEVVNEGRLRRSSGDPRGLQMFTFQIAQTSVTVIPGVSSFYSDSLLSLF